MSEQNAAYQTTLTALQAELIHAEQRVAQLRTAIKSITELLTSRPMVREHAATVVEAKDPRIMEASSMVEAATLVLQEAGRPLHVDEIIKRIIAKGYPYRKGPKAMKNALVPSMHRKAKEGVQFTKQSEPGVYGLRNGARAQESTVGRPVTSADLARGATVMRT